MSPLCTIVRFPLTSAILGFISTAHTRAIYGKLLELPVEHRPQ